MPRPKRCNHKKRKASSSSFLLPPPPSPPWVELPEEITANIVQRLGAVEILENAQRVCTTWWKVCKDPSIWRVVDLKNQCYNSKMAWVLEKVCRIAVDRSQGQLLKINIENFGGTDLLNFIARRSSHLKHLRLVGCCYISDGCLAAAVMNFPLLEELHVYLSYINKDQIEVIGQSCPLLVSFTMNAHGFLGYQSDDEALAVARNMPELRHLSLLGNALSNEGLHAILDGCPHLESLDLRHCYNIDLDEGDLERRCKQQIVDLKDPHASTYGYEFNAEIWDYLYLDSDYPDGMTESSSDDEFHGVYDDFNDYYD